MRKLLNWSIGAVALALLPVVASAQEATGPPLYDLEKAYLRWPLLPEYQTYAKIEGDRIKAYVDELSAISLRSRDAGMQYWGRIAGTASDRETQQWLQTKFTAAGLSDVRVQDFDMLPHWSPNSWSVSATGGGKTVVLSSARPVQWAASTPPNGVQLDAAWVGLGTPADFIGRDVKGKAVFIHSVPTPGMRNHSAIWNGAMKRAEENGAAAVVVVFALPGNVASQLITTAGVKVPLFSVGLADGTTVREMVERGESPKVELRLDAQMATGRKTANVWGTLKGQTDENILLIAHYDAHFEGALDNGSGVATMVALADYFAKVPLAQRRRTMTFVGLPAHHTGQGAPRDIAPTGSQGARWIQQNDKALLARTALVINVEHTAQTQTYLSGAAVIKSNTVSARRWFVSGSDAFKKLVVGVFDRFGVATYALPEASPGGELGYFQKDAPGVHVIDHIFYHTDMDTSEYVPAAGLEGVARAYARLVDEVNQHELKELRAATTTSSQ